MAIRNLFRSKQCGNTVSSATNGSTSNTPKCELTWELQNEHCEEQFQRQLPQRSSSARSEVSWTSCSSTSSTVSFSDTVEVQEIAPISSLAASPAELWYQRDEYTTIQKRIRRLAKYVESYAEDKQKNEQQMKKVCTRGLEWMIEGKSTQKHEARQRVLGAQQRQRDLGTFDEEGLALAYKTVTEQSAAVARDRASSDAKAIELYLGR